ncbi:MAG: GntR family transcriptional regulator [Gammaproteobacteria bacterium]
MSEPAYVSIAGDYARSIRSGELPPGTQLPSYSEIAELYDVSDIVVRGAIELLQSQGLVRTVRRRGVFVAHRPNLVRVAPERQMESAEVTFQNESDEDIQVERETREIPASEDLAQSFGISTGTKINYTVTRVLEAGQPVSVSDTYQPLDVADISDAASLEETLSDRVPVGPHAEWLRTAPGTLVKTVRQRFLAEDGRLIMTSDVSYPRDRYDAFVFRMTLDRKSS